jgi:hypothetical protein
MQRAVGALVAYTRDRWSRQLAVSGASPAGGWPSGAFGAAAFRSNPPLSVLGPSVRCCGHCATSMIAQLSLSGILFLLSSALPRLLDSLIDKHSCFANRTQRSAKAFS